MAPRLVLGLVMRMFKCRNCGEKYPDDFAATNNVAICRWCSGEEKDDATVDPAIDCIGR